MSSTLFQRSGFICFATHFAQEPGFCKPPVPTTVSGETFRTSAVSSTLRPPNEAHLDNLALALVHLRQANEREVTQYKRFCPYRSDAASHKASRFLNRDRRRDSSRSRSLARVTTKKIEHDVQG